VIKVSDVTHDPAVSREIALIKVHAPKASRSEIVALAASSTRRRWTSASTA
jgi:acetolactate synthase I/III small subunit